MKVVKTKKGDYLTGKEWKIEKVKLRLSYSMLLR